MEKNRCKCECCRKEESVVLIWSAAWITAPSGPMNVCKACFKLHEKFLIVQGVEAQEQFKKVKQFLNWDNSAYDSILLDIQNRGELLKGSDHQITLLSRLLYQLDDDYWMVTKLLLTNFGQNTFWISRLEYL